VPPEFLGFLSRLGARRVSGLAGVSLNTIQGIASGRVLAGPIVRVRISNAMEQYKVSLLRSAGASVVQSQVAARLPFGKVDSYVSRMERIMDAITRDRFIEGEGYTRSQVRGFIQKGMDRSEKGIFELFDKYVG